MQVTSIIKSLNDIAYVAKGMDPAYHGIFRNQNPPVLNCTLPINDLDPPIVGLEKCQRSGGPSCRVRLSCFGCRPARCKA